jgi:hypothetical protein
MMLRVSWSKKAPFVLITFASMAIAVPASRMLCDSVARRFSVTLSEFSDCVRSDEPMPSTDSALDDIDPVEDLVTDDAAEKAREKSVHKVNSRKGDKDTKRVRGVLVRRSVVLAAVQRGVRPSAHAIAESSEHPAGLIVYGWGGIGGLQDGDIITRVGGHQPSSSGDVAAAVVAAYRRKVYAVSGTIFRDGEEIRVTVELPSPESSGAPAASLSR